MKRKTYVALAEIIRGQRARIRRGEPDLSGLPGDRSREKLLQRVAALSAWVSEDGPQPQRCEYAATALPGRDPADLVARDRSSRPLHELSRRIERSQPHRCFQPAFPHAPGHPSQARSIRMHGLPSGTGRGYDGFEAHNSTLAWEQPILPAKYIESSCGECHRGPLPGTPQLNQGRNLLARQGCVHCHTVKLPDGT